MPKPGNADLHQKAVYWEKNGVDNYGEPTVDNPIELDVRWFADESDAKDAEGNLVSTDVSMVVSQDLELGSIVWFGDLNDRGTNPTPLYWVVSYRKVPDVKLRGYRRTAKLARYHGTLPTIS